MSRGARIGKRAPTTVQIGLRLLLIAILVRIVFISNALLALDLSNGSPAWSVNRLEAFGNGTPPASSGFSPGWR